MSKKKNNIFAAIHLGSEKISLQIIEYTDLNKYKIVEEAGKRVKLGEETFKHNKIPFSMVTEICDILKGYKRLMDAYGVKDYVVEATTAVREAENQVYFLDQVKVKTGLRVDVVDMPREIFTKFTSILRTLEKERPALADSGTLLVDISSGGLGITYMKGKTIKYQQNLHIGIIRIKEDFDRNQRSSSNFGETLTEYISSTLGPVKEALAKENIKYLVLSGTETELMLKMLGKKVVPNKIEHMKVADFKSFYDRLRKMNLNKIIKAYGIQQSSAELIWPTIILYQQLLALTPAKEIIITPDRFIDGMKTLYIANKANPEYIKSLESTLMSLIHSIGERYYYDKKHAVQVERLALLIFEAVKKAHGLTNQDRIMLRAACGLHDIGKYICLRSHAKYSYETIMSTDILGFSDRAKEIIALTAYYHSHLLFETRKSRSPKVDKDIVPIVAKLAAILRLADAMDRSYLQKIKNAKVAIEGNELIIRAKSKADLTLEEWSFENKGSFFEEVYGLVPVLERVDG